MTPESAQAFARYNRWMNDKVYAAAASLTDEERKQDRKAFFRSIHATLNHLLVADRIWISRVTGEILPAGVMGPSGIKSLDHELHSDFTELRTARAEADTEIDRYVATLTAETLAANVTFIRRGAPIEVPRWWAVAQMFNHQTHHRGQVTTLLTQAGHDVGPTDLFAMLSSEPTR